MEQYEIKFINDLKKYNIELNDQQIKQFKLYADLLIEWNQKINLTAICDYDGIYQKHFLDCILPFYNIELKGSLCDVGAGAGFPSIVLKIVYPDLNITIVEPLGKRCTFLNLLVKELGLNDVDIQNERSEDYAKVARESFDFVSARAVANLCMLSELCIPLLKVDGYFIALKGEKGEEEANDASFAIKTLGCIKEKSERINYGEGERINIYYHKIKSTPKKYPRMFAKIKKNPLKGV